MLHRPFKSVLVANRGEIAYRIVRESQDRGLEAIAVFSSADRGAPHVWAARTAVHLGEAAPAHSYLNIEKLIEAARSTSAEAIHPGYGFLSENAEFAQHVIDAGLVWIGPAPQAIRAMGDKGNAKAIAREAGVPVIPGYQGDDQSDAHLLAEARQIGWPVLIKAANGGGGRGQRRVVKEIDFTEALAAARRESLSAFASDKMILERALENVRHVEVQIFGDAHGNVIHLGERDCTIQRRNQKLIEEAPAPGVNEELRARMGDAAVRLARAVNYTNAGTVEFLLDRNGKFYFLEMNTRIQVEHPVTEEVTGTNLIQWQFDVAMGLPLPMKQSDVRITGHAIEARLCAEDPANHFQPQTGRIEHFHTSGLDIRIDKGAENGDDISTHYDSMIAKVIAKGSTREEAREKLVRELGYITLLGPRSNLSFLTDLLERDEFRDSDIDVGWLEREPGYPDDNLGNEWGRTAALALAHGAGNAWHSTGLACTPITLRERDNRKTLVVKNGALDGWSVWKHQTTRTSVVMHMTKGASSTTATVFTADDRIFVTTGFPRKTAKFEDITYAPAERKDGAGANTIRAPMSGRIVKLNAKPGATVTKGQILVILEAMKMEHELRALADGTIETVAVKPGDQVAMRQLLVSLKPQA